LGFGSLLETVCHDLSCSVPLQCPLPTCPAALALQQSALPRPFGTPLQSMMIQQPLSDQNKTAIWYVAQNTAFN
jgi:hypothetical protein